MVGQVSNSCGHNPTKTMDAFTITIELKGRSIKAWASSYEISTLSMIFLSLHIDRGLQSIKFTIGSKA